MQYKTPSTKCWQSSHITSFNIPKIKMNKRSTKKKFLQQMEKTCFIFTQVIAATKNKVSKYRNALNWAIGIFGNIAYGLFGLHFNINFCCNSHFVLNFSFLFICFYFHLCAQWSCMLIPVYMHVCWGLRQIIKFILSVSPILFVVLYPVN